MTFSKEIKEYLSLIKEKKSCCQNAYEAGRVEKKCEIACLKDEICFLRGCFVTHGFVADPQKAYELSFFIKEELLDFAVDMLNQNDIPPFVRKNGKNNYIYLKESSKIEDFLALIGGAKYALMYMEQKIINGMRGKANRVRNAETANLDRTAKAAAEQCLAIKKLIDNKMYNKLSPELKECAQLRLNNPDMNLEELREMLSKPISKSGLNHRFSKIIAMAEEKQKI